MAQPERRVKVLLELRPAFDGHAGIPQEARLLFRGLRQLPGVDVEGLLQSSGHVLSRGLPVTGRALSLDQQFYRLSRVVVSSRQELHNARVAAVLMAGRHLLGGTQPLDRFEAGQFRDFIWQSLFARTLHADDFDCVTSAQYRVARVPWTAMHRCALATRYLGGPLYPRIDTRGFDAMISETPYPGRVSRGTRLIVRYHDAIPLLMPHTIAEMGYHQASHYHALRCNVEAGAHFSCVSEATRKDLVGIFPQAESRSVTIHNMVSHHYFLEDSPIERVPEIIRTRLHAGAETQARKPARVPPRPEYLLMVSTIEPRKNHLALLEAWEHLRATGYPDLKLVIVGMLGWRHEAILAKFRPWIDRGELFLLEDVASAELRLLYRHARAAVCPSFGEGFDFSGVEAMRCGTPVIASDIAVHREVFANGAHYFSPYSRPDLVRALVEVIGAEGGLLREALVQAGTEVAKRYLPERILPQWQAYLSGATA